MGGVERGSLRVICCGVIQTMVGLMQGRTGLPLLLPLPVPVPVPVAGAVSEG